MRPVFLDPAPVITATGVLTPLGEGAAAIEAAATGPRTTDEVTLDLASLTGASPLRFRRMDRYATLGFAAASLALREGSRDSTQEADADVGILIGSSLACWGSNVEFYRDLFRLPVAETSPALFARTVPNAVNGEISIAERIGGPNHTFVSGWSAGAEALCEAAQLVASRAATRALAGGVEAPHEVSRRMHAQAREEPRLAWLTRTLAEAAGMCVLARGAAVPGALRLHAFTRAFDPTATASLSELLDSLGTGAVSTVFVANSVPPDLLERWHNESAGVEIIDLAARTGEIGAAGAPAAVAVACRRAALLPAGSSGTLVVSRGVAGGMVALALAPS